MSDTEIRRHGHTVIGKRPKNFKRRNLKMKKIAIALSMLVIIAVMAACASKTGSTTTSSNSTSAITPEAELLVGTFKLENTDLAVTAAQAKTLLPLWQTLQALSSSSTAATEETDAVVAQIKNTMTAAQMDKINAMKLTQQDMLSLMSQAGVPDNGLSTTATPMALNGLPSGGGSQGGAQAGGGPGGPGGGGMPAGGPPSDGGGMPGGSVPGMGGPSNASGTPQAPRADANQVPPPLFNTLIELLQKKTQ
jgi:hypothetical protein